MVFMGDPTNQDDLLQAEIDALATRTISRIREDKTILYNDAYKRMMDALEKRASQLEQQESIKLPLEKVNDWLSLAVFAEDRVRFAELCKLANERQDPIYRHARHWIVKLLQGDTQFLSKPDE